MFLIQAENHCFRVSRCSKHKIDYVHNNPLMAETVAEPHYHLCSSAIDYSGGQEFCQLCWLGRLG